MTKKNKEKTPVRSTSLRLPLTFTAKMDAFIEKNGMTMTKFLIKAGEEFMERNK